MPFHSQLSPADSAEGGARSCASSVMGPQVPETAGRVDSTGYLVAVMEITARQMGWSVRESRESSRWWSDRSGYQALVPGTLLPSCPTSTQPPRLLHLFPKDRAPFCLLFLYHDFFITITPRALSSSTTGLLNCPLSSHPEYTQCLLILMPILVFLPLPESSFSIYLVCLSKVCLYFMDLLLSSKSLRKRA